VYHGYKDQNDLNEEVKVYVRRQAPAGERCAWCQGKVAKDGICYVCYGAAGDKVRGKSRA